MGAGWWWVTNLVAVRHGVSHHDCTRASPRARRSVHVSVWVPPSQADWVAALSGLQGGSFVNSLRFGNPFDLRNPFNSQSEVAAQWQGVALGGVGLGGVEGGSFVNVDYQLRNENPFDLLNPSPPTRSQPIALGVDGPRASSRRRLRGVDHGGGASLNTSSFASGPPSLSGHDSRLSPIWRAVLPASVCPSVFWGRAVRWRCEWGVAGAVGASAGRWE